LILATQITLAEAEMALVRTLPAWT